MDRELLSHLEKQGYSSAPLRPPEFGITAREFASEHQCGFDKARRILSKAVADGALATIQMLVKDGLKHCLETIYYRPGTWQPYQDRADIGD